MNESAPIAVATGRWRVARLPRWLWGVLVAIALLFLWFGVLGGVQAWIAPDPALRPAPAQLPAGGSAAVGFAARLIDHEVNDRVFTPNDGWLRPTGLARRAPAYQAQLVETVAAALDAAAGEAGGSHGERLAEAAALLATPPGQSAVQFGWPLLQPSAERQYRRASAILVADNAARAVQPPLPPSARLGPEGAAMLGALAEAIEAQASAGDRLVRGADPGDVGVQLAASRGAAQAAAMLLRGVREDHAADIRLSGRATRWSDAIAALDAAAAVSPLVAGRGDLVAAGYQLLLAGAAIRDILGTG